MDKQRHVLENYLCLCNTDDDDDDDDDANLT